ncbi:pentapeptide repeat protein [Richelia sinica FACHB-800]|uniref:Pentapeptide repeat protein n=1 Tax=Richelia sinica FACHB-800 TaxID=1357546 RepID=A0A975TC29_9NOST|nr:pentapeptide repeat-containing protein [Richelia sinica]MBD2666649.1 pentapeptide repeat-containing protein [Richelia sinica FACHB-800]QXE25268.1 pentapeptide repeat protein [Richelia sinica FACHB-800]
MSNHQVFVNQPNWLFLLKSQLKFFYNHKYSISNINTVVNQLSNQNEDARSGAINDLVSIANHNPQSQWIIIDLLCKFVKKYAPLTATDNSSRNFTSKSHQLLQSIMHIICSRDMNRVSMDEQIDLSYTDLRGLDLPGANLQQANLYQANLSDANLLGANLSGTILTAARLSRANLRLVNLSEAILNAANLDCADLSGANLHQANLFLANLKGAKLTGVNLDRANLRESKL